jgi:peptidoglycan/LPS O-acetylase OafA/YrhL
LLALALFISVLGITLRKRDVLIYALGLQTVFSPAIAKPVLTLWFVGVIVSYYLGFAIILRYSRTNFQRMLGAALFFVLPYLVRLFAGFIDDRFFLYFSIFAAGILFAGSERLTRFLLTSKWLWAKLLVALAGLLLFRLALIYQADPKSILYFASADSFILTWIVLALALFSLAPAKPGWRVWGAIAAASFFTYLLHRPFWQILIVLFNIPPGFPEAYSKLLPGSILALCLSFYMQKGYNWLIARLNL